MYLRGNYTSRNQTLDPTNVVYHKAMQNQTVIHTFSMNIDQCSNPVRISCAPMEKKHSYWQNGTTQLLPSYFITL